MSILTLLQNYYQDEIAQGSVLGALPDIQLAQWDGLTDASAQNLVDWVLQQEWSFQQDVIYDWLHGLYSPAIIVLNRLVDLGYGLTIANCPLIVSAKNKVYVAHTCEVAIRKDPELEEHLRSLIVDGLRSGDSELIAMDFQQWLGDFEFANLALDNIEKTNLVQNHLNCSSTKTLINCFINFLEEPTEYDEKYGDFVVSNWERSCMPQALKYISESVWYWENSKYIVRTQSDIELYRNRAQFFLQDCPLHVVEKCINDHCSDEKDFKRLDSIVPLLPVHIQKSMINNFVFDNQPYTHQLRFQQELNNAVQKCGVGAAVRKL